MFFPFLKKIFHRHHISTYSKTENRAELVKYAKNGKVDNDAESNEDQGKSTGEDGERDEKGETVIMIDVVKESRHLHRHLDLERKINGYVESFTIHGLTRSVTARRTESAFWTTMLTIGIVCASVVIYGLIQKYSAHSVYTELISKVTEKNYFPSVTFCEKRLLQNAYFSYCGIPLREYRNRTTSVCTSSSYNPYAKKDITLEESMFKILSCETMGNTLCNNSNYFKPDHRVNGSCITWNFNGDLHDPYSYAHIQFEFHKPAHLKEEVEIYAIPHDHRITEIDITKKIEIDTDHKYVLKIDKTFVKRLPAPFPSNCTNDNVRNIFPGRYSRFSCMESYYYIDMYKKCGDVYDYHKPYMPKHIVETYSRNSTNVTSCMKQYMLKKELRNLRHCNFACEILDLSYYASFQTRHNKIWSKKSNITTYDVGIQLKTANEYRIMEEKQLYTLSQMACEIGGFVGLIMGMSVISVIEIIVFIALSICKKVSRIRGNYH